jgi:hypothetical protein
VEVEAANVVPGQPHVAQDLSQQVAALVEGDVEEGARDVVFNGKRTGALWPLSKRSSPISAKASRVTNT